MISVVFNFSPSHDVTAQHLSVPRWVYMSMGVLIGSAVGPASLAILMETANGAVGILKCGNLESLQWKTHMNYVGYSNCLWRK